MTILKTSSGKDKFYKFIRWLFYIPLSLSASICIYVLVHYLFNFIANIIYYTFFDEAMGKQNAMNFVVTKIFYQIIQGLICGLTFNMTTIIIVPKYKKRVALFNVIVFIIPSLVIVIYFWDVYQSLDWYKLLGSIFTAFGMWLFYKKFEE